MKTEAYMTMEYIHHDRMIATIELLNDLERELEERAYRSLTGEISDSGRAVIGLASGRTLEVVAVSDVPGRRGSKFDDTVRIVHILEGKVVSDRILLSNIETVESMLPTVDDDVALVAPNQAKRVAVAVITGRGQIPCDHIDFDVVVIQCNKATTPFMDSLLSMMDARSDHEAFKTKLQDMILHQNALLGGQERQEPAKLSDEELAIVRHAVARDQMYQEMIRAYRPFIEHQRWVMPFGGL